MLNLVESSIVHSFLLGVLSDQILYVHAGLLKVDLQDVDLFPQIQYGILVYIAFDSMIGDSLPLLLLCTVLVLLQKLVFLA